MVDPQVINQIIGVLVL